MQRLLFIALFLAISPWCMAQQAKTVPQEILDEIATTGPVSLPKYLTPEEAKLPLPTPSRTAPPTGTVHCSAEYEPQEGLFIAWEGYTSVLTELAVGITTGDPEAIVYVVVDSSSEQSSVYSTLNSAGADMTQVEFIIRTTDTVWIRDYGPRFIYEDGQRAIIDHTYNRPRPNDNLLNDYISMLWGEPQYQIPLTHGGGNFHLFANGDAFMTDLILTENPGLSEQDVIDLYADYQNVDLTIYPGFPTYFDSTQHIDMWMLPLDDHKIIIGQYSSSTGQPYTITEDAVADLTARGYTVYRTPGWSSGGTHYTYTNAVILNDQVFIPRFGGSWTSQDSQALGVFQTAMPDHDIIQVYCGSIIHAAGAVHCIVMHVPNPPFIDCNGNGVPDDQDIAEGTSEDCQPNGIPDECETDCQPNGVPDDCDIRDGTSEDCNDNAVPDECDIAQGTSQDLNGNDIPDECEIVPPLPEDSLGITDCTDDDDCHGEARCVEGVCYAPKHRYISIERNPDQSAVTARRIKLESGEMLGWVGEPEYLPPNSEHDGLWVADGIATTPYYAVSWPTVLHVTGCMIATGQTYLIQAIAVGQDIGNEYVYSEALALHTPSVWGDMVSTCAGNVCLPPDGVPGLADVMAVIAYFQGDTTIVPLTWLDIDPSMGSSRPDQVIGVGEIMACIAGFQGEPYPGLGPLNCP